MTELIRPAALSAAEQAAIEAEQAQQQATEQLVADARAVVGALPAPPGGATPLAAHADDLTVEHTDLAAGLVVLGDGDVALGVHPGPDEVRLVGLVDGGWSRLSGPLADLAALGVALAGGGG